MRSAAKTRVVAAAFAIVALTLSVVALAQRPPNRPPRGLRPLGTMTVPGGMRGPRPMGFPTASAAARPTASAADAHEGEAAHEAAHEAENDDAPPKPLNVGDVFDRERPAIIALLINFGLLAGLYYVLGKKPIAEALKQRRVTIAKDIEDARKRYEEAQKRAEKYQADLKNADADAASAKAALVAAGKGEVEKMLTEAEERSARMKRDAERLMEQEQKQREGDLHRGTVERAVEEAMKVLERNVTPDDHARLAQELLAELAKRPAARAGAGAAPSVAPTRGAS